MNDERSANAIDKKIGQRVRTRRLEIGMSQERLAELLGVTFQQVQKYEKGVNRIAASRLHDIAGALDMPVARFFEGLGGAAGGAEGRQELVEDVLATPEGAQLMQLFASIKNLKIRRRVIELVKALAEEAAEGKRS
ncbi:MAG TPA: helix-turn-helix domain-containing protein [Vitreimonas sp.]|uniref:helix-turn-helix domain-containing protein n=1 Tax=Vitreimonas sp. TaxID=3069702 RepID=UPI002D46EDA5|nr:helix-turn-helix domain-containing protein [Vitreimonas sp.]HYD89644.1 helix-turn-helix domain-containing protein [Vitreimonas sp.]